MLRLAARWTAIRAFAGRLVDSLRYQALFMGFVRPSVMFGLRADFHEVDARFWPRLLLILLSALAVRPFCWLESVIYGRRIAAAAIAPPPVFIIGHWRSGTTHLHNLMSCDEHFGALTMFQALAPDCSLIGRRWLKPALNRILPARRPMDEMTWSVDSPQEEEVALGKTTLFSFYSVLLFPRLAPRFARQRVLDLDLNPKARADVARNYERLLKIATLHAPGRRLVLKNPVNTARVRLLLELFPGAKFIHIHRSPYEVFVSTRHLQRQMRALTELQQADDAIVDETIFALYDGMMRRYLEDRRLIPKGDLAEVRFDDLERDPSGEIERIYATLGLPGFAAMRPELEAYLVSLRTYRKNTFSLAEADRARVARRWAFAFSALDYQA
ncbi:sulfotransferase [Rhodoblastus acidophilus]|jgi:omega-hydroxy-beta-dihydromenaquinone-9 sulfotransferase|uniref:Sulfotransferase n=1 Tax=Rhodoblastus acidophilus TaxID=1074 RepID=A0A6N8DWW9_RHOAC|nr:sulfotransferase [Rhodoblastus acidophilus]MCW2276563.1 hypothetical protein [Rhodoblastus acidophilus]MTV33364.1 sulfotransferase [Rhodoblastus acidophilus]